MMEFRLAGKGDLEEICRVVRAAVAYLKAHDIDQWDGIYPTEEHILADIESRTLHTGILENRIAVIYTVNDECDVQYRNAAWKYPDREYRVLHRLCVDPAYQNRGIARRTLAHMENELRESGIGAVRLDVFSRNPYALSLYRNSGYEETGTAEWRKGSFLLMEKYL